jgi:putative transposase
MKKRFTEEQIIGFLREADAGLPVKGCAASTGSPSRVLLRLKALESENTKLKKLLANSMLEIDAMREVLKGK